MFKNFRTQMTALPDTPTTTSRLTWVSLPREAREFGEDFYRKVKSKNNAIYELPKDTTEAQVSNVPNLSVPRRTL